MRFKPLYWLQSRPTADMAGVGPESGIYENNPPDFPLETLPKNFLAFFKVASLTCSPAIVALLRPIICQPTTDVSPTVVGFAP